MGNWEGRALSQLMIDNQAMVDKLYQNPMEFCFPDGECFAEFEKRVLAAVSSIRANHDNGSIVIVTHGGVCRMILGNVLGVPPENWLKISQDYACINILEWYNDSPTVRKINYSDLPL